MNRYLSIFVAALVLAIAGSARANPKFAGRWKMTSMKLTVSVESWGEHCGPRPKGYSSSKVRPVEIVSQGKHLVFTKGGLRTDRCVSPNPHLQTKSKSIGGSKWHRVCETSAGDSKYERGEYTLTAVGNDRLEYTAKSKFDWSLKGDSCVAFMNERRVYVREEGEGSSEPSQPAPEPKTPKAEEPEEPEEPAEPPQPDCERDGPIKKLTIAPKESTIGPSEKVCFKAFGVDAAGCRFRVDSTWTVSQGGQEIGGLMARNGCFKSGATAADSEGVYDVHANAEGKDAAASVTVSFPDLGELLRARLHPAEELHESGGTPGEAKSPAPAPAAAPISPPVPASDGGNTVLLVIIIGCAVVLAVALLIVVVVLRRNKASNEDFDDDWPDEGEEDPGFEDAPAEDDDEPEDLKCPKCGEIFPPTAKFCPHDASSLVPVGASSGAVEHRPGMVCPKCHRGYDPDAKFCPHDSEKLMPYPEWRRSRKGF